LKLWADSWDLHSNNNLNGIQAIVGKNSWSYGITSKENIAVRLCRIDHAMMTHNYTPDPPEGVYCFSSVRPSFRPSKILFVACFSAAIDGRNRMFCHKLHIGMPYCGKRFGGVRYPLPFCRLSWFLYTLNIYAGVS
jgi:hypothetical protein